MLGLLAVAACSDDPANVEGDFTVAITNRDNGCNVGNWTVGNSTPNIQVTVTQETTEVTANVTGLVGGYLDLVLGSHAFIGEVDGEQLNLDLFGSRSLMNASCVYTYNAKLLGNINGDTLEGRIEYRAATTTPQNPDCAAIQGCLSFQEFNGTRPPT